MLGAHLVGRLPCYHCAEAFLVREWSFSSPRPALRARGFAVSGHKSAKEPLSWRATRYWIAACGATCTCPKCRRADLTNVAAWGARKRGYRLNRARASASNPRLTRYASQHCSVEDCSGPSRIALGSGTLLAVLASARLLRLYGRLNFIEFSWEKVAYRRRFSRSSPPAQGFAPTASPHTPGGCLQILANTGAAKNGPMRDLGRLGGGLIGVSVHSGHIPGSYQLVLNQKL